MDYFKNKVTAFADEQALPPGMLRALDRFAREVARDQRHACTEAISNNHGIYDREATDRAASVAMNAKPEHRAAEA